MSKSLRRRASFLLLVSILFFSFCGSAVLSAPPTTEAECRQLPGGNCQKEGSLYSCSLALETPYGKCNDRGDFPICCISAQEEERCGDENKGTCRYYDELKANSGCKKDEKVVSTCSNGDWGRRNCCVSILDSRASGDKECLNSCQGAVCKPDPVIGAKACPSGYKSNGSCTGQGQTCCVPESCTPNPSQGSPSNSTQSTPGSASLTYTPLENLPGFEGEGGDFTWYFKNIYLLALWIVALSALFMLIVGGFLYLSSAGNTHLLGTAKKTIFGALIGLVIALISWLLLDTINSDLTNLRFSGLSGAIGGVGTSESGASPGTPPPSGSGSGCGGAQTQSQVHCGDASQALSDALKCMVDKLGTKKMQLSSVSEDSGGKSIFTQCRDNYSKPPCEHTANSCHYGGKAKAAKSCAADISNSYTSNAGAASKGEIKAAARACAVPFINDEGNHVHISVSGCNCDGHS